MKRLYKFPTRVGDFFICIHTNGRYYVWFEDELIDHYINIPHLLDELTRGHCPFPSVGDPEQFNISEDLSEWVKLD